MDWEKTITLILKVIDQVRLDYVNNNMTIRDDIFGILEKHCTVIYYPLENEKKCGFHTRRFVNNNLEHFVYINTAQPVSKQVFAAAHELGHVWGVADCVWKELDTGTKLSRQEEERIINRFAAELLMPNKEFRETLSAHVIKLELDPQKIPFEEMVRLMVLQMNDYMVPCEAVRRRLVEVGVISKESGDVLKEQKGLVNELVEIYSKEQNTTLDVRTLKKTIPRLRDLMEDAEADGSVSKYILEKIKKDFEIEEINSAGETIRMTTEDN